MKISLTSHLFLIAIEDRFNVIIIRRMGQMTKTCSHGNTKLCLRGIDVWRDTNLSHVGGQIGVDDQRTTSRMSIKSTIPWQQTIEQSACPRPKLRCVGVVLTGGAAVSVYWGRVRRNRVLHVRQRWRLLTIEMQLQCRGFQLGGYNWNKIFWRERNTGMQYLRRALLAFEFVIVFVL